MFDYGEFCPISMATNVLCERWTLQIVREMVLGATKFSEFQRHMPKISPTLLKNRLRTLEDQGIIIRKRVPGGRSQEYFLTSSGKTLEPVLTQLGKWGFQYAYAAMTDEQVNVYTLMRDVTAAIETGELPAGETLIQINFTDLGEGGRQFIRIEDGSSEICDQETGHDVDVYLTTTVRTLTEIWYGEISIRAAEKQGHLIIVADPVYTHNISKWLRISEYSKVNPHFHEKDHL